MSDCTPSDAPDCDSWVYSVMLPQNIHSTRPVQRQFFCIYTSLRFNHAVLCTPFSCMGFLSRTKGLIIRWGISQRDVGIVALDLPNKSVKVHLDWRRYRLSNPVPTNLVFDGLTTRTPVSVYVETGTGFFVIQVGQPRG